MGRRLAMVAVEGNHESPWILALGQEREVRISGGGDVVMTLESRDGAEKQLSLLIGVNELDSMSHTRRYKFTKRAVAVDAPTTVEVVY